LVLGEYIIRVMGETLPKPRYREGRKPWLHNPIYRLFEDYFEEYLRAHIAEFDINDKETERRFKAINGFMKCSNPNFGFTKLRCLACGNTEYVPFTCAVQILCSSCDKKRAMVIADHILTKVMSPIDQEENFYSLTISIPKRLRPYFQRKK